ncbi:transporter substrate-binding domain-containing protein [Desulfobulbus alkaliphilus]|uniref:transporter substrate-binding domain-containing protein n=1 Tax=Desulfobulbus alkaliphilus TaxID=869814 RepID=UPI0019656314|nr:transporter substrate-binding domain-containing protein [Desulfobulbus alkaliphilus]MBM9536534.1 transporter substrate-binding domain-containing protein [Desulfobulbus alkaliphilus]
MKRLVLTLLTTMAMLFMLTVVPGSTAELQRKLAAESTIEQIIQRGVIRVGMDVFVPHAMKDKKGELIGFEIDVARKLAEDMGIRVEFVPTKWSGIIPSLIAGRFDVIIGGMTMTTERNMKINFTNPYYFTSQGLLAHRKMSEGFTIDDFNSPEITLVARLGSTAAVTAKNRFPLATLRLFDDEPSAVQEVRNGRVHGMVAGQPLPAHSAELAPETLMAYPDQLMKEPISFGIRKGDVDTLNFFNNWIEITKNRGWFEERYNYWFGSLQWQELVQ